LGMKITKLTPKQKQDLHQFCIDTKNEIYNGNKYITKEQARKHITKLYKNIKIKNKKPFIIIFDDLFRSQIAANYCSLINLKRRGKLKGKSRNEVDNEVYNEVRNEVDNEVRNEVDNEVYNEVRNEVRNEVDNEVYNEVYNEVSKNKLVWFGHGYGLFYESWWLTFYEYFRKLGVVKSKDYKNYREFMFCGVYNVIWLENFVIITRTPKVVRTQNKRMHSLDKPSFEWKNDTCYYHIDGVFFRKEMWEKITKQQITAEEVVKIENQDQRMVALKYYGTERLLKDFDAKLIDESKRGNKLYEVSNLIPNEKVKLLVYSFVTKTGETKTYTDFILEKFKQADNGMAWKHNMTAPQYSLLHREG
ncbi:MAG: hypothetical protein HZC29_08685, partial [Thaumarchaeota archaeon]|nr:hypothetical protein [Nitrososphaerota archaeon]